MPVLHLKGLSVRLYATLKRSARDQKRSLNHEAIFRLEQAYGFRPLDCPPERPPPGKQRQRRRSRAQKPFRGKAG